MFKKKKQKEKAPETSNPYAAKQPTLREIEDLFVSDDYPLKGKKPSNKPL